MVGCVCSDALGASTFSHAKFCAFYLIPWRSVYLSRVVLTFRLKDVRKYIIVVDSPGAFHPGLWFGFNKKYYNIVKKFKHR